MSLYNDVTINTALDASGTATITGPAVDLRGLCFASIHTKWTKTGGTLAGTVVNQKSNDGVLWFTIDSTSIGDSSSSSAKEYVDIGYRYIQSVITLTGGAATIYQATCAKG